MSSTVVTRSNTGQMAFAIKWLASIIQILGYSATAFGWTPLNIYLFLVGLVGWLWVSCGMIGPSC